MYANGIRVDWPWPAKIFWTYTDQFSQFWSWSHGCSSRIQARISIFAHNVHLIVRFIVFYWVIRNTEYTCEAKEMSVKFQWNFSEVKEISEKFQRNFREVKEISVKFHWSLWNCNNILVKEKKFKWNFIEISVVKEI